MKQTEGKRALTGSKLSPEAKSTLYSRGIYQFGNAIVMLLQLAVPPLARFSNAKIAGAGYNRVQESNESAALEQRR